MTLPPEYFAQQWDGDDDPWRIADRFYERRKRDLVLAALPRERFATALEVGCAAGHLTARLAPCCDALLACDVEPRAVALAAARTDADPGVTVEVRRMPQEWPQGRFDLVVVSEVGYYFGGSDLAALADRAAGCLTSDGVLLACHWRHPAPDYPSSAADVHDALGSTGLTRAAQHAEPDLLLDVWTRAEASVARAEGWL